jgi:hypothetical protein
MVERSWLVAQNTTLHAGLAVIPSLRDRIGRELTDPERQWHQARFTRLSTNR